MSGVVVALLLGVVLLAVVTTLLWFSRAHTLDRRVGSFHCWVGAERRRSVDGGRRAVRLGDALLLAPVVAGAPSAHPLEPGRSERRRAPLAERRTRRRTTGWSSRPVASDDDFYLLLSAEAYTGLTSWIEATPSRVNSVT